jgi:hypothetical protein
MSDSGTRPWFRPGDALVALGVAAASAWACLAFRGAPGNRAMVYLEDREYGWFDLREAKRTLVVPTRIGDVRLEIGDGAARVAASPCPNRRCIHTGTVRRLGGEIACAPAHLLLVVEGGDPAGGEEAPDAVSF